MLVDGRRYGQVTLATPLDHYHHAARQEYQAEVALLSRHIVVRGNQRSEPVDTNPLQCGSSTYAHGKVDEFVKDYDQIDCKGN